MSHYPPNTVYICESTQAATQNPISNRHRFLIVAVVVERDTGLIVDAEINSICELTTRFVRDLLVGLSLAKNLDEIIESLELRYHGASRKGLISCLNAAAKRFASM